MKNIKLLVGVGLVLMIAGIVVMVAIDPRWFGNVLRTISGMNSRVQTLVALPFIVLLLVIGHFLFKGGEERKWKKAILKTQANKQKDATFKAAKDD